MTTRMKDGRLNGRGLSDIQRFTAHVEIQTCLPAEWTSSKPATPCHLWSGSLDPDGYARFTVKTGNPAHPYGWQTVYAHRWIYQQLNGDPDGVIFKWMPCKKFPLDHLCRTHNCVNAEHVEVTTTQINLNRGHDFRGSRNICRNHHNKDIVGRRNDGSCAECHRAAVRKSKKRPEAKVLHAQAMREHRLRVKEGIVT